MNYATHKSKIIIFSWLFITGCAAQHPLSEDNSTNSSKIERYIAINHPLPKYDYCPFGMIAINDFCIDRFEYPNIEGQYPEFAMSAYDAEKVCSDINKRLCSYKEWHRACVGFHNYHYSYGPVFKSGICNDNKRYDKEPNWMLMWNKTIWKAYALTLYKGEPSGSRPECITDEGVYDMPANLREWVKDGSQYVVPSGYWYGTMAGPPTCDYVIRNHSQGFASYEFGTRCCKSL